MSETRRNHLTIDGAQLKEDDHVASYKPLQESDTGYRTSKTSLHKSKERLSHDGAEEKLLKKEDEGKIATRVDMVDAKYEVGDVRNGDAKFELDAKKQRHYNGLSREEVMRYAEDPFWVRLRWFLFLLFWAVWLVILAAAVVIVVHAPKCPCPPPRTWYEKGPLVDMSAKKDYDVVSQDLQQLKDSKVPGIFAFACQDTYEILEESSTCLKQFKKFAAKAKTFGIKIILDMTANFVPKVHKWFQLSENRTANYSDYFIWASSKEHDSNGTLKRPNNWVSTLDSPAWTWSEKRQEFYLHQFGEDQPDLNFNNPQVVKRFDAVIKAWMQAGAAGIRLHNARELLVNMSIPADVPRAGSGSAWGADHTQYAYWLHRSTRDLPALDGLLAHWSHLVAGYAPEEETVFTIAEKSTPELFVLARNTSSLRPPSAAPVALDDAPAAALLISKRVKQWPAMPLTVASGDNVEIAAFAMLLPAAPVLQLQHIVQNVTTNVDSLSHLVALREDESLQHGRYLVTAVPATNSTHNVIVCARWKTGHTGYLSVYNPESQGVRADLSRLRELPAELSVRRAPRLLTNYTINEVVFTKSVLVPPKSSMVYTYVPKISVEE